MLTVIFLVFATFAATNIDNLLLMVGLVLSGTARDRLFLGFMGGMVILLIASAAIGLVSLVMPVAFIGFLGVIPVLVGLNMLYGLFRKKEDEPINVQSVSVSTIITLQLSNGVDTMLVFAPLFADSLMQIDISIAIAFLIAACAWYVLAISIGHHANKVELVARYGAWIAPVIMVVLGLYILDNTVTDVVRGY